MPTAYVSFCRPVNYDTATSLLRCCRETLYQTDKNGKRLGPWEKLRIMLSSHGGGLVPAFAAYNEIRSMPTELTTLNTGTTDSSAIMIFMAGKTRLACENSAFLFHQTSWTFSSVEQSLSVVADAQRWMATYQGMMANIVAANSKLEVPRVVEMMQVGTNLTSEQALDCGLIHGIEEPSIPDDARWWQA
jgi:ATP-dependent protease ClpP protease subunit